MGNSNDVAIVACGDFWKAQDAFTDFDGILKITAGYTGGKSSKPTYHDKGDHVEALHIEFDPRKINFESILRHFFAIHDPTGVVPYHQRSVIFYLDEFQKQIALKFLDLVKHYHGEAVTTMIEPAGSFHPAEEYHQNYLAKLRGE